MRNDRNKTVLLLKGVSQYNAMRNYIEEIAIGFESAGYNVKVFDGVDATYDQLLEAIKDIKIDIFFTCNAVSYAAVEFLQDARYVTYLCDHPAAHRARLAELDERAVVFVCDMYHETYIRKYYPNIKNVCFVPLSGSYSRSYVPYDQRQYDVVFTGTYIDPKQIYQNTIMANFDGILRQFVETMVIYMERYPSYTIEHCLTTVLEQHQVTVSDNEFDELVDEFDCVAYYARFYYRDRVVRALTDAGIQIHVFGNGWDQYQGAHAENLLWEQGDELVAREAVANARISLNVQPWFKAGFQERIATAMLSGTVAVTDDSEYISQNFTNEELCIYSLECIDELPAMIQSLLNDHERAAQIAANGKQRAHAELTWQHRTNDMIDFLEGLYLGDE